MGVNISGCKAEQLGISGPAAGAADRTALPPDRQEEGMARDTDKELQDLIQRGRRSIEDIRRFLAESERRQNPRPSERKQEKLNGVQRGQG